MLVAPTEPKVLRELGKVSLVPESYGVDFLFHSPVFGMCGVQRKELKDLVASVNDGRLSKEVSQMKQLPVKMLVVEGRPRWDANGSLMSSYSRWTMSQHLGIMFSMQLAGCWTASTESVDETSRLLSLFGKWITKQRHGGLAHRPNPKDEWGRATSRDWAVHLLQSFNGVGADTAGNIYDHFGGLPLMWTVGEMDLLDVKGVGKGRAKALIDALRTTEIEIPQEG